MFRMKAKPVKPNKRQRYTESFEVYDTESLDDIYKRVRDRAGDPAEAYVEKCYDYYDTYTVEVKFPIYESEESYQKRLAKYEEKMADWNAWYSKNEQQIKNTLAKKAEASRKKAEARILQEKAKLEKELKKLEKQAAKFSKI